MPSNWPELAAVDTAPRLVVAGGIPEQFSERELEVLALLAAGLPNEAIAERLIITVNTVKAHLKALYSKLAVHNRTQAVAEARNLGLLENEQ